MSDSIRTIGRSQGPLGKRWLAPIDQLEIRLRGRIRRGRTLARGGRVRGFDVAPGSAWAEVDDGEPRRPVVRVRTFDEGEWVRVVEVLLQRLDLLATLLEGVPDRALVTTLADAGVDLLPRRDELDADCDCGDYAVPCAHAAAIHHVLAEALDGEPLLLFALRGRPREQLLTHLRRAWGDDSAAPRPDDDGGVDASVEATWFDCPTPLPAMSFSMGTARAPGLVELGPLGGGDDVHKALTPLYEAGAEAATTLALDQPTVAPVK